MKYDPSGSMEKCAIKATVHARCCFAPANRRRDSPAAVARSAQWNGWNGPNAPDYMVRVAVVATPTVTGHRRRRRCCTVHVANTWRATGRVSEGERGWRCAVVVAVPTSPSTRQERVMLPFKDIPGRPEPLLSSSCKEYPGAKDRAEAEEKCRQMPCVRHMAARSSPLAT